MRTSPRHKLLEATRRFVSKPLCKMGARMEVRIHSILFGPPSHAQTRRARGVENNTAHITLFMLRVPEYVCTAAMEA